MLAGAGPAEPATSNGILRPEYYSETTVIILRPYLLVLLVARSVVTFNTVVIRALPTTTVYFQFSIMI